MESYEAKLMIQHGRTMKEYVEVPSNMLQETDKLSAYLQKSLTYVSSLKPKPTKNKS